MCPCVLATLFGMLTTVSVTSDATVARAFAFLCNTCVMVVRRAWSSLTRRKIEHSGRAFDYLSRSEGVHANTVARVTVARLAHRAPGRAVSARRLEMGSSQDGGQLPISRMRLTARPAIIQSLPIAKSECRAQPIVNVLFANEHEEHALKVIKEVLTSLGRCSCESKAR
jgi:hypothetical protein